MSVLDPESAPNATGHYYGHDLAFIHDAGFGDVARHAAGRLLRELGRAQLPTGTVVDLGCGSGILAAVLAEAGYRVLGLDVSGAMIDLARKRVPTAEFRVGSFVSTDFPSCVAIVAVGEVLNYTFDAANDDRARLQVFRRAYEALVPGGVLLFDIAGLERLPAGDVRRTFTEGPGWVVLVESRRDDGTHMLTRTIDTFRDTGGLYRRDSEVHRLALLDLRSTLQIVTEAGFDTCIIGQYSDLPLPPGVAAFLARKPDNR